LNINMTSNASKVQKAMQGFSKQFPFAMSRALNATAFQIRKEIVEKTYPQSFDAKNRAFANAMMRVEKANKRKLSAAVFDRFKRNYMTNQAEGGIKQKSGVTLPYQQPTDQRSVARLHIIEFIRDKS